jgi:hypothetical protein
MVNGELREEDERGHFGDFGEVLGEFFLASCFEMVAFRTVKLGFGFEVFDHFHNFFDGLFHDAVLVGWVARFTATWMVEMRLVPSSVISYIRGGRELVPAACVGG